MDFTLEDPSTGEMIPVSTGAKYIFLIDPSCVEVNDLVGAKNGSVVRLRRPAWGRDVIDQVFRVVRGVPDGSDYKTDIC